MALFTFLYGIKCMHSSRATSHDTYISSPPCSGRRFLWYSCRVNLSNDAIMSVTCRRSIINTAILSHGTSYLLAHRRMNGAKIVVRSISSDGFVKRIEFHNLTSTGRNTVHGAANSGYNSANSGYSSNKSTNHSPSKR